MHRWRRFSPPADPPQASDLLGLNRSTLRTKLRTLGLAVDKIVTGGAPTEENQ